MLKKMTILNNVNDNGHKIINYKYRYLVYPISFLLNFNVSIELKSKMSNLTKINTAKI